MNVRRVHISFLPVFLLLVPIYYTCKARGMKRKFDFDLDKAEIIAREAEEAALRQIEIEQVPITFIP